MARTKNRGLQQSFSPSYTVRRWRLGKYIRLSKEDLKKGKDDSNSVINQRDLLNDFYQKHIGEFEIAVMPVLSLLTNQGIKIGRAHV